MSAWLVSARVSDPVTRCEASVAQAGRRQLWVRAVSLARSQPRLRSKIIAEGFVNAFERL